MPITLGGQQCQDPRELFDLCLAQRLPTAAWYGKANSYRCPMGTDPGRGHLLLTQKSLTALDLTKPLDLIFDDGSEGPGPRARGKVTIKGVSVINATLVTPGVTSTRTTDSPGLGEQWKPGDDAATYVVEIADRRERIKSIPALAAYNLRDCNGDGYLSETLDFGAEGSCCASGSHCASGSGFAVDNLWTWQDMICDLVAKIDGFSSLCLPYCPQGDPENFTFWTVPAWTALNVIADRLGCGIVYNPLDDNFSMVEVGAADTAFDTAIAAVERLRVWDTDPQMLRAPVPRKVRVLFPFTPPPNDGTSPWDHLDEDAPEYFPSNALAANELRSKCWPQTNQYLIGDLGAPTLSGQSQTARALERRDKFYQAYLDSAVRPMLRVFAGVQTGPALLPGKRVKAIAWYDFGTSEGGIKTEVYRGLNVMPAGRYQHPDDPCMCCSFGFEAGSGSSGSGSQCDVRTDEFFRRSNNNCFYLAGCLSLVDGNGRPIPNMHIRFTPDPVI